MSRFQHDRDNVLSVDDRRNSALKCISLLNEAGGSNLPLNLKDREFFRRQFGLTVSNRTKYAPSDRELQWLRDLVSRYVTN